MTLELLVLTHRPMSVPLLGASHVTCTILRSDAASEMLVLGVNVFISIVFFSLKLLFYHPKEGRKIRVNHSRDKPIFIKTTKTNMKEGKNYE